MESGNSNLSFTHSGSLPPKSADAACWEGSPLKRQTIQTGLPLPPRILLSPSCGEHPYAADTPGTENTHCPRAGCAVWTQLSAKSSSRQPHPWMVSAALLQPMAKCSGDAGETVRSQMLQKPSVGGRGCVGTASQLSFATCPMLLSHCAVTKVDTSYINPPQHLLSQRFVTSGTGSGDDERDSHFSSAGWQPGCPPPPGQEQRPKPPHVQVQVLLCVTAQSQATT